MRIVGGKLRGLKLADVGAGDPGGHLRPTADRVRESIFNLLINSHGVAMNGARVLDLFAGTGAMGLEALSRGAGCVSFIDNGAAAHALLRQNVDKARATEHADIWRRDATQLGPNRGAGYDLVLLDPPYGSRLGEAALASALAGDWLAPGALVVWEESAAPVPPPALIQIDQRRYGDTLITLLVADS